MEPTTPKGRMNGYFDRFQNVEVSAQNSAGGFIEKWPRSDRDLR